MPPSPQAGRFEKISWLIYLGVNTAYSVFALINSANPRMQILHGSLCGYYAILYVALLYTCRGRLGGRIYGIMIMPLIMIAVAGTVMLFRSSPEWNTQLAAATAFKISFEVILPAMFAVYFVRK